MPDLASAMKEVSEELQNGNIKPPHILTNVSGMRGTFGVFGWYEKSENGVYVLSVEGSFKKDIAEERQVETE